MHVGFFPAIFAFFFSKKKVLLFLDTLFFLFTLGTKAVLLVFHFFTLLSSKKHLINTYLSVFPLKQLGYGVFNSFVFFSQFPVI